MNRAIKRVNLISGGTQGLIHDMKIVKNVIDTELEINIYSSRKRNLHLPFSRAAKKITSSLLKGQELNIFFEIMPSNWHNLAAKNILIPNQEWVREDVEAKIQHCSEIWCKSQYAVDIFCQRGHNAKLIGFTSRDMFRPEIKKDYSKFIHIPGRSDLKGTRVLLDVWKSNSQFPPLTVLGRMPWLAQYSCENITVLNDFVSEEELVHLVNSHGVHLCPSEAEGFGHYISEAMSAASVVLTTDAPPMREYALEKDELLVAYKKKENMAWGHRFFIDGGDLEQKIYHMMRLSDKEKIQLGEASRRKFEKNDLLFKERVYRVTHNIVTSS